MTRAGAAVLAAALCGAALAGCSLIYGSDFYTGDPIDAAPPPTPDAPELDANPELLALERLEPATVFEGEGTGRPIPIVIHGDSIVAGATATLTGAGFEDEVVELAVAPSGKLAAFELAIPVRDDLGPETTDENIEVTVSQGDGISKSTTLTVSWLNELTASVDAPDGTLDTADLEPRYSTIDIDAPIALTGTAAARLVATSSITVNASLDVSGKSASNGGAGAAGGPGGCAGGNTEGPGQCVENGGRQGGASGGGGGGGHATAGSGGSGDNPGAGGMIAGNSELAPLAGARGHGGGGGGNSGTLDLDTGGPGGGGGGVLELTSAGMLIIGAGASFTANGGNGAPGTGLTCSLLDHGGGGGGGSGGAIFVRAASSVDDQGAGSRISVAGGAGGDENGAATPCNEGGNGADGRVRVDLPNADPLPPFAAVSGDASLYRGPMLLPSTPAIVRSDVLPVTLVGAPGQTYFLEREGSQSRAMLTTLTSGSVEAEVSLEPGLNRVCAVVTMTASIALPEAVNCITVAYIPEP